MRVRRVAERMAPFLIALPLAVLLVEGALRLGLSGSEVGLPVVRISDRNSDPEGRISPGSRLLLCYPTNYRGYFRIDLADPATRQHYESLGMRKMDKALPLRHFAVEQLYNSLAYLAPEFGEKRDGTTRVVLMGDSFNMGWGLRPEDRVSERLQALLDREAPGRYEVLNAGLPGADFPELYDRFPKVLALRPDVLVLGMTLNDTIRRQRFAQPPLETSPLVMVRRTGDASGLGFFDLRLVALVRKLRQDRLDTETMIEWYKALGSDLNAKGIVATRRYIREMDATLKQGGGRFILALWPLLVPWDHGYPFREIHESTAGFATDRGIEFVDLLPPLLSRKAPELWVHPVDRHPNEVASALAAERLAAAILSRPGPASRADGTRPPV